MKKLKQTMKRIATLGLTAVLLVNTVPLDAFAADPAGAGGDVSIEAEVAGAGGDVSIEAEASYPAFVQSETVDGVKITIGAEEGVFPEGAVLSAEKVTKTREEEALEAVEGERPGEQNVAASYTFDIKVLDRDGNEIQPADESRVKLSFKLEEVADSNLETNIYHIRETDPDGTASGEKAGDDRNYSEETTESNDTASSSEESDNKELIAEKLEVETEGDTATAEADGFSLYIVEFTYNDMQYVMSGDSEITLSEILDKIGLTGEVSEVSASNSDLFSVEKYKTSGDGKTPVKDGDGKPIEDANGVWFVILYQAFSTTEWIKVTIGDVMYEITVTYINGTLAGSGTEADPYVIADIDDWKAFASNVKKGNNYGGKFVELGADLDFTNVSVTTISAAESYMVGKNDNAFSGTFNGKDHKICNFTITGADNFPSEFGFFYGNNGGSIKNTVFENCTIRAASYGGIVASSNYNGGTIENCRVSGTIIASASSGGTLGGIASKNFNGYIKSCAVKVVLRTNCSEYGFVCGKEDIGNGSVTDTYYTSDSQVTRVDDETERTQIFVYGAPVYRLIPEDGITLTPTTDTVAVFDGTKYYAADTEVTFTASVEDGKTADPLYCNGEAVSKNNGSYTCTVTDRDVTVQTIESLPEHSITVSQAAGGSMSAGATAHEHQVVSLTAMPDNGYLLNGVKVKDGSGSDVEATCAPWYASGDSANKATFHMPASDVTVTPVFSAKTDTDAFSVRIPKTGTETVVIPDGVAAFKVYDHAGPDRNYGPYCSGKLVLTAPQGCGFQIAGNLDHEGNKNGDENFTVSYGGGSKSWDHRVDIDPVIINSNTLILEFISDDNSYHNSYAGLDLTVTMVDFSIEHTVTISSQSNGTMTAETETAAAAASIGAAAGTTVTIKAYPSGGYMLKSVTASYMENGVSKEIPVSGGWRTGNVMTMTMPYADVTVTPVFAEGNADGGPKIDGLNYVGTDGSDHGYYAVDSPEALNALAAYVNAGNSTWNMLFKQTADIDMQNMGYSPIGCRAICPFNGTYDGNGFVILNISHDGSITDGYSALFGRIVGATVKNVNMKDCSFTGSSAGGIAASLGSGTIENCSVLGGSIQSKTTEGCSGGIVGNISGGDIKNSFTDTTVGCKAGTVDKAANGPLIGVGSSSLVKNSYYTNSVVDGKDEGTKVSVYTVTLNDDVMPGSGMFRTIGRTDEHTWNLSRPGDSITLTAELPASGMKRFTTTAGTLAGTTTAGAVTLTMPAEDVTVGLESVTPTITVAEVTYTGSALTPTVTVKDGDTTLDADTDYTVNFTNNNDAALSTSANPPTATITGKGVYFGKITETFTINKKSITPVVSITGWTYGDTPNSPSLTAESNPGGGTVKYQYRLNANGAGAFSDVVPTNASHVAYTVQATIAETANYKGGTATATFKIEKKPVTITGFSVSDKIYNGTTDAAVTGMAVINGLVGNDDITVTAGTAAFADKNVGTDKTVTFSGFYLSGESINNYTLSAQPTSVTADITPKSVTVSGITVSEKEYDGTTTATLDFTNAAFGRIGSDDLTVNGSGTFADANAGTDKDVTISGLTLGGTDKDNYTLPESGWQTSAKGTITPKSITGATVMLSETQKEFTGSEQSVSVTSVKLGDTTLTADTDYEVTSGTTGTAKNTYTVTVTGKGNYKDSATADWEITGTRMTISAPDVTTTYDGVAHGITVNVTDPGSGATVKYGETEGTYNLDTSPTIINVSDSPKTVYFKVRADNYADYTGSATITISKANAVPATDITKYVPGNKAGEYTITLPALPNGAKYYFTKDDTSGLISTLPAESTENTLSFSTNSGKSAGTSAVITVEAKDAPNYKDYSFKVNVIVSEYTVEYDWPERTNIWLDADNELAWSESGVTIDRSKLVVKKNGTKVTNVSFTAKVDSNTLTSGENTIVLKPGVHRIAITGDDGKLDDWVEFKVIKLNEDDKKLRMDIPLSYALPGVVTEPNTTVYYDDNNVTGAGNTKLWYRHEIGETHISPPRNDDELYANNIYSTRITDCVKSLSGTLFKIGDGDYPGMRISNVNGSASLDGVSRLDTVCGQLILHREGEAIHQKVDLDGVAVSSGVSGGYVWYVGDDCPDLTLKEGKVYLGDVCIDSQNTTITDGKDIFYAGGTEIFRYGNFVSFGENYFNLDDIPGVLTCASRKAIGWDCNCQKDANGDCVSCYSQNGDTLTVCGETIHLGQYILVGCNFVCLGDKYLYDFKPASEGSTVPDLTKIDVAFDADSHILTVAGYAINVGTRPICWLDSVECTADVYYPTMNYKIFKPCAYVKYRTGDCCYSVARKDYVTIPYSSALSIQCDPQYKVGDPIEIGLTVRECVDGYGNTDGRGARGDITVFLDNKSERRLVNDNPSFTYVYDPGDLAEGPHQLCVILDGDETHAGATATATFTVVRTDPVLKLTGKQDTKGEEFENGAEIEYDPETPIVINAINDAAVSDTSWKWQISNTSAADAVELGETTNNSGNNAVNSEDISLYTVGLGTVKLWAGFSGNGKYKPAKAVISFRVVPKQVTNPIIEVLNEDELYYDGTAKEPEVRVYYASGKLVPADQYEVTYSNNTNASGENSKAKVIVKSKTGALYTIDATKEFMIQESVPVIEELPAASAITYGQTLADSTITGGLVKVGETDIEGSFAWKTGMEKPSVADSGETLYDVVFTPNDTMNYETAECKVKITVNKADPTVTAPTAKTGLGYTGIAQTLVTQGSTNGGTLQYALGENKTTAPTSGWSDKVPTGIKAGTYYVWYKAAENENYNGSTPGCVEATITPAANGSDTIPTVEVQRGTDVEVELNLKAYIGANATSASFEEHGNSDISFSSEDLSGSILTFKVTSQNGGTGSIDLTVSTENYTSYKLTIPVTAKAKTTVVKLDDTSGVQTAVEGVDVSGLDVYTNNQNGTSVKVELDVKTESEVSVGTTVANMIKGAVALIFSGVDSSSVGKEYLDISVKKTVDGTTSSVTDVGSVVEIAVKYDLTGKYNPVVIREHDGSITKFTALSSKPTSGYTDGTFYVDAATGTIYIYSKLFSTYSIAYATTASYTVKFDAQGGTSVDPVVVKSGGVINPLPEPTRSGYSFNGWYNGSTKWTTGTAVTGNMTLTASWTQNGGGGTEGGGGGGGTPTPSYTPVITQPEHGTITVNPASPQSGQNAVVTVTPEDGYETENVTVKDKDGNTVPVTKNDDGTYTFTQPATGSVTIEAVVKQATDLTPVIKKPDHGAISVNPAKPKAGEPAIITITPDEGYEVDSVILTDKDGKPVAFTLNEDGTYSFIQPESGCVTIEAVLRLKDGVIVRFDLNGKTGTEPDPQTFVKGGKAVRPNDPAAEGYKFTGWYTDKECTKPYDFDTTVEEDIILYAGWEKKEGPGPDDDFGIYFAELFDDPYEGVHYNADYNDGEGRYEIVYTGAPIKPLIKVTSKADGVLKEGIDYSVSYSNNKNYSKKKPATIKVSGKGFYKSKKVLELYILQADLEEAQTRGLIAGADELKTLSGKKLNPVIVYRGYKLKSGDLNLSNKDKITADTTTDISGKGNFTGTLKDVEVKVIGKDDQKKGAIKVNLKAGKHVYNGEAHELSIATADTAGELTVTAGSSKTPLEEGTDFVVSYSGNTDAGKAAVTITGIGEYNGTVVKNFTIEADKATEITAELSEPDEPVYFNVRGAKPDITVTAHRKAEDETVTDEVLTEGKDYKVSYSSNMKIGDGAYTVKFLGNYKGHKDTKGSFKIVQAPIDEAKVEAVQMIYKKPGKYLPKPFVSIDGVQLKNSDYTYKYYIGEEEITSKYKLSLADDEISKTVRIVVTGKGNYTNSTAEGTYEVVRRGAESIDLTKAKIVAKDKVKGKDVSVAKQEYNGYAIEPEIRVMVRMNKKWVDVDPADYTVSYINNVNKGTATILVSGNGNETIGSKTARFSINTMLFERFNLIFWK